MFEYAVCPRLKEHVLNVSLPCRHSRLRPRGACKDAAPGKEHAAILVTAVPSCNYEFLQYFL